MVITLFQKKKIQRTLILVALAVVFITAIVIWWGFFMTSPNLEEGILIPPSEVHVDTSILSHPLLQELDEPRVKTQIPLEVGRDNPLLPLLK